MIEDVVKKIKDALSAQMPARLDAIQTQRGEPHPADILDFYDTDKIIPLRTPSIAIDAASPSRTFNEIAKRRRLEHRLIIHIAHENAQELAQQEKDARRYVEAVEKILSADPTLGGTVEKLEITEHDYGESYEDEKGQPFRRVPTILLTVEETYSP